MSDPEISVLMSCRDGKELVGAAADSILNQSFGDFEFIWIDDGSVDGSLEVAREFASRDSRIRVLENASSIGLTRSLNRGLKAARGRWIARQDADDFSLPHRLERQRKAFLENSTLVLVGGQYVECRADGSEKQGRPLPCHDLEIRWEFLFQNPVVHTAAMFLREIPGHAPVAYREQLQCGQDYGMWKDLLDAGQACNLEDTVVRVAMRPDSISRERKNEQQAAALEVLKEAWKDWIMNELPRDENLKNLRGWYLQPPGQLHRNELQLCRFWFQCWTEFSRRHATGNAERIDALREKMIAPYLKSLSFKRFSGELEFYRILGALFRDRPENLRDWIGSS